MWPKNKENKLETLLLGDDLGICHMYNFTKLDWHYCEYKLGSKDSVRSLLFILFRTNATCMKSKTLLRRRLRISLNQSLKRSIGFRRTSQMVKKKISIYLVSKKKKEHIPIMIEKST